MSARSAVRTASFQSASGAAGLGAAKSRFRLVVSGALARAHDRHRRKPQLIGARAALGVKLSRQRDQVGELANRLEVTERGESLQPARIQVVAGQQGELRVDCRDDPGPSVVEQVSLSNRLDQEGIFGPVIGGAGSRRGKQAEVGGGRLGVGDVR